MKPELIKFVSGTKAKASEVNENFEKILNYAETASAIVSFDIESTYKYGQWVLGEVDGKSGIYESLVEENRGHALSDQDFWTKVSMGGGGLEIGDIGIAPLGIDETKGKRRYLNGSIIIQDQYQVFTQRVKTAIQTHAGLGCTEEEWQTISNLSVGGQCGKFVIDDEAGTIRLPKIIMPIQGLTDLTKLGEIVEAGLPNITGKWEARQLTHQGQALASGALYVTTPEQYNAGTSADNAPNAAIGLDASLSNPIYGNSTTVQQEQIQYPYFIQVATGASVQDHIANKLELNNPAVLLEGKYFDAPVYNVSWLQANESYNGSLAFHPKAYNALLVEQNPNVLVGTTVDNYTKRGLSVKLNTEEYTDYDFVLNTTSQTFRCPLKIKKASGRAVAGNGMTLGLTDGSTNMGLRVTSASSDPQFLGFRETAIDVPVGSDAGNGTYKNTVNRALGVTTDPTKSGIETSDQDLYLYFYVGETVQNANLVNVGRIEEKVASLIPDNSSFIASYAMPSNKRVKLTMGASGSTYTAPANGWFTSTVRLTANGIFSLDNKTCDLYNQIYVPSNTAVQLYVPVKKGDLGHIEYTKADLSDTINAIWFIYAEGEV